MARRALGAVAALAVAAFVAGCALFAPLPPTRTVEERLTDFPTRDMPLEGKVEIFWDAHQVPFIVAETDGDAAFALGLVHAHLRLGQMDVLRRISQGRLSEMAGPFTVDIDRSLRILNFGRAAKEIEASLPPETHTWLTRFVEGLNHYQANMAEAPYEAGVLGLELEPWTIADLVTIGRLAASDVNWFVWFRVWELRQRPDWPQLWARFLQEGGNSMTSFAAAEGSSDLALLSDMLAGLSRSGSNSFAVAPSRSKSGHAMIANDPHLGFVLPNVWLIAGIKSPSYHVVGLMVPGLPFVAVGRNSDIAWGGTNMRAASSDLFDVSKLPPEQITEREEPIHVRWWFDDSVRVRETPLGPVISDSPLLEGAPDEAIALRWRGHDATDEFTAMLKVNRARTWQEFRSAFRTFAVSAQNMLYADTEGNIGQVMAVQLPARPNDETPPFVLEPDAAEPRWSRIVDVEALPAQLNPAEGFLASANNRPTETPVPVGYFFSPDDRIKRLKELVGQNGAFGLEEARLVQTDVFEPSSFAINQAAVAAAGRLELEDGLSAEARQVLALMRAWDGHYRAERPEPVAYEAFFSYFVEAFYGPDFPDGAVASFLSVADLGRILPGDLERADAERTRGALVSALEAATPAIAEYPTWGDMHRLILGHPLRFLPVLGSKYEFVEFGSAGSRQTVMKTNSSPSSERHRAGYGSQARHVSDMADPDENYFVLLGGQDGWFGSDTFVDQVDLWRAGDYVRVPLRLESVRAGFPHKMMLSPK